MSVSRECLGVNETFDMGHWCRQQFVRLFLDTFSGAVIIFFFHLRVFLSHYGMFRFELV